ncbi:hypothetical protein WJX79_001968 [Trebouxia sp. C0005]|nr:MAG: activator of heat shock 90kDa ATPase h (ISS) [Trebouxia sp. A1-2]
MAKWEDKDPKWIVQDRQDGSNVNGWHWEEKNQLGWSKQKLEELLVGLLVDMSAVQGNAKVTALKDLKGEALLTTRKGRKRFAMYDLTVTLTWQGSWVEDDKKQVTGEIIIGEFASANDPDEYEWSVTAEGTGTAQDKLKDHVNTLREPVFDKLQRYVTALNSLI